MATSDKKVVLITGGNRGIGYETAKNLILSSPTYHIILGSRDLASGEKAAQELNALDSASTASAVELDVTSEPSVAAAVSTISSSSSFSASGGLHALVNNAGIIGSMSSSPPSGSKMRSIMETNVVGAVTVTEAFLPLLLFSPSSSSSSSSSLDPSTTTPPPSPRRLIFLSSSTGSITHASNPSSPYYRSGPQAAAAMEYRTSKAATNMLVALYWARFKDDDDDNGGNLKVFGADPGLVATDFTGDAESLRARGAAEPEEGGRRIAEVVKGLRDGDVGRTCGVYGVSEW